MSFNFSCVCAVLCARTHTHKYISKPLVSPYMLLFCLIDRLGGRRKTWGKSIELFRKGEM